MSLSYTIKADAVVAELDSLLNKLNGDIGMGEVASYMEREVKGYFAAQAGPDGPWAPLAASTLQTKGSGAILRETGSLVGSISGEGSGKRAVISAGTSYGIYHHTGTSKMPQRRFMGFKPEHEPRIREIISDRIGLGG